jgi:tRNA dimethylallyltransferase
VELRPAGSTSTDRSTSQGSEASVIALCGPTSAGKTGVAIAMAEQFRAWGLDPVAVNCDSIQVYRGLEVISGAATEEEQRQLEHRLVGFVDPIQEMSAGTYAAMAHREIDELLSQGKLPLVVGGTGLWLRAALSDLDLRPPTEGRIRDEVEQDLEERGASALHAELPSHLSVKVHPNDRNRIVRWTALLRNEIEPQTDSSGMWGADLRHSTRLVGLIDSREELARRIDLRVDEMHQAARAEAEELASKEVGRTAGAAIGLRGFLTDDLDSIKAQHRAYAKRQITWMKKIPGLELVERRGDSDAEVAARILDGR